MEKINVITRAFAAAPANETIEFPYLILVKEVLITTQTAGNVTVDFGQAGPVRGIANWTQNRIQQRTTGASSFIRATPNIETRRITVDVAAGAGLSFFTIVYADVEK